jgi:hypothetical protein
MPLITKDRSMHLKSGKHRDYSEECKMGLLSLGSILTVLSACMCVLCFVFRGQIQNSVIEQAEFFMQEIQTCLAISRPNLKTFDGDNRPFFKR